MRAAVTNAQVGEDIGLTHASVSRIRSGHRLPSIAAMMRIDEEYGWGIEDQAVRRQEGTYHRIFEVVLAEKFGAEETVDA